MPRRHRYQPKPFPVRVSEPSLAAAAGIQSGDILIAVNDEPVADFLDFFQQSSEEYLDLELQRAGNDQTYKVSIQRVYGEPLGITPNPAPLEDIVECENKCVFCFIHQQPKGLRRSLFIRDDDFRYSFANGNFITLTNLSPADWHRIYAEQLSPLNVSVHSMSPAIRTQMIKHKRAGRLKQQLESMFAHGIQVHTQIVLCPGYNDGLDLDRSLEKLMAYYPNVLSIAIVPLGLTDYRAHLPQIPKVTPEIAESIIAQVTAWQERCQRELGTPLVRLGDEFYWLTGRDYPPFEHYGSFEQMEDGVGGARRFLDSYAKEAHRLPARLRRKRHITIMTGQIGADIIRPVLADIQKRVGNLTLDLIMCKSEFWGPGITVSGLLTAQDLLRTAAEHALGDEVWLPEVMVRNDEQRFLDDVTVAEVSQLLERPVIAVHERAEALIRAICQLNRRPVDTRLVSA
ncbi:MAG: hypothetical protein CVV27_14285 [Candidatus Melainabacteria bacterium HGW-Melainabacteria-1]|nr:MAG: hypothetical protein CVV27_14285 [Candidatus Melainabacteria bacterium HGW-Melainabacteria-1]